MLACAIAIVVLIAGGAPTGSLGPAAALAQAAEQTARADSGVVHTVIAAPDGATLDIVARFDGDDAEAVLNQTSADGQSSLRTIRVIDGVIYDRVGDGAWTQVAGDGAAEIEALRTQISNTGLVDLARAATTVTQAGDVYTAQIPAEAVGALENLPLGFEAGDQPEAAPVSIAVGGDGLVRSVSIDTGAGKHSLTYSELNQPQAIAAP